MIEGLEDFGLLVCGVLDDPRGLVLFVHPVEARVQLPHMDHGRRGGHVQFAEFRGQYLSMRVAASEPRGGRGESLTTWPEAKQNELK